MKKTITILPCLFFLVFANAQIADVKTMDDFIKKVNDKLITIQAAEYSASSTTIYRKQKPLLDFTVNCKFQFTPFDSLSKYRYLRDYKGSTSSMYSYLNDLSLYNNEVHYRLDKDMLYITDVKKYEDKRWNIKKNPNIFNELLYNFLESYGRVLITATEITSETKNNKSYRIISYTTKERNDSGAFDGKQWINTKTSLYVTDDYLPLILNIVEETSLGTTTLEYSVKNYKLLETIPDDEFLPKKLGSYKDTYHYQGDELGYILDTIKQ